MKGTKNKDRIKIIILLKYNRITNIVLKYKVIKTKII